MCVFWFCLKDELLIVLEILDVNSPLFPGNFSSETVELVDVSHQTLRQ